MTCGIYKIHCNKTNKDYIGQSKNIENRWNQHKKELNENCHINYKLQEDWILYGENEFKFEILKEDDEEFLNVLENYFIQAYDSIQNGYNIKSGNKNIKGKYINKYNNEENVNLIEILENISLRLNYV